MIQNAQSTKQEILDHLAGRADQFGPDRWDAEMSICDHLVSAAKIPPVTPAVSYLHDGDFAEGGGPGFGSDPVGVKPPQPRPNWKAQDELRQQIQADLADLVAEGRIEVQQDEYARKSYRLAE
jgi:hypothetical protein